MSGHWLSFQIRQTTPKFEQNSETSETNTESLLSKFYLCTVPRHHRHQPATHCPKNRFQLLTKLHKERNKIAAEAAEATTHTKKNDDDDNDEGGRTKTKEEGRRTKDECRRTRTNTHSWWPVVYVYRFWSPRYCSWRPGQLVAQKVYVYLYRCNIIEYNRVYYNIL